MSLSGIFDFWYSQVLQDLGLPTGPESKSESSGDAEGPHQAINAADATSNTSEEVCTQDSSVMEYLRPIFKKIHNSFS